jgi:hypothetical protein
MNIWDGEDAFSIQAAFRSEAIALSRPVIRFQLALFWSTILRSPGSVSERRMVSHPHVFHADEAGARAERAFDEFATCVERLETRRAVAATPQCGSNSRCSGP